MLNMEPLLPDLRVTRIEHAIRRRFPDFPEQAALATYYQDPETVVRDDGLEVPVEAQAVMVIAIPNPRTPEFTKVFTGRIPFRQWQTISRDIRHDGDVRSDPAYQAFERMVPSFLTWYANMLALN